MNNTIFSPGLSLGRPFADWLDVTCSPDCSFLDRVDDFCDSRLVPVVFRNDDCSSRRYGEGSLKCEHRQRFHRVSLSGAVLSQMRSDGDLEPFLGILSEVPHSITRLDVAQDFNIDGPKALRHLEKRHPTDKVNLSRKAMAVTRVYSARESDRKLTGSWYVGRWSKAKTSARVYDKSQEVLDKHGLLLEQATTRIEITVRKAVGASLRDAADPERLFYHVASPSILPRPGSVGTWEPLDGYSWSLDPVDTEMTLDLFRKRLEFSPDMDRLAALASRFGPTGVDMACRVFRERLTSHFTVNPAA